jgi:hypothetical protein
MEAHLEFTKVVVSGAESTASTYNQKLRIPLGASWYVARKVGIICMYMSTIPSAVAADTSVHSAISLRWNGTPVIAAIGPNDDSTYTIPEFTILPFRYAARYQDQTTTIYREIEPGISSLDFWITYENGAPIVLANTGADAVWTFHVDIMLMP